MNLNNLKETGKREKSGKQKMTPKKKAIVALGVVLCTIIIVFAVSYGVFLHYYNKMNITSVDDDDEIVTAIDYEEDDLNESELTDEERAQLENLMNDPTGGQNGESSSEDDESLLKADSKNVINILLVGTDSRKKGNRRSRTDTMVILSIDKQNKRMIMTSVLRDTYVKIPGVGRNRLNAAFVFGGPKLLFKTFDENFDIQLDKYVQIDFYNFIKLVDAVGGVDMKLSAAEVKVMNQYVSSINGNLGRDPSSNQIKPVKGGTYHLNGIQALGYSRIRYVGNADFGRTERQRKVMGEIIKKTKTLSVSELNDLADIVLPMVSTNLSQGEVMSLLLSAKEYLNYTVVNGRMPIDGSYRYLTIRGASVLGVDFQANKKYWYKLVYGKQ